MLVTASAGISRGNCSNPAAAIRIQQLYGSPVLLSGVATLVLTKSEVVLFDQYIKKFQQNLLRLPDSTPACVVHFLAGTLPGSAQIHLKQLNNFGMIARQPESVLHKHAMNVLTS